MNNKPALLIFGYERVSKERTQFLWVLAVLFLFSSCRTPEPVFVPLTEEEVIEEAINVFLMDIKRTEDPFVLSPATRITDYTVDNEREELILMFSDHLSFVPIRPETSNRLYQKLEWVLPYPYRAYNLKIMTLDEPVENLIPNYFRASVSEYDFMRFPYVDRHRPTPVVRRHGKHVLPVYGLDDRQIALWHSHGWYYNQSKKRWEWQRPRLFQTVEDLLPMAFTIPYLIPMLENAGAYVWVPRERDIQTHEVIIDNAQSTGESFMEWTGGVQTEEQLLFVSDSWYEQTLRRQGFQFIEQKEWIRATPGFAIGSPPYQDRINPFQQGSFDLLPSMPDDTATVKWIPDIPESGRYAVYVSYISLEESTEKAQYRVYHEGGMTDFSVNQRIGGGTWIYLGHFDFREGIHPESGRVELTNIGDTASLVTADAVRFGGGMGNIEREGQISNRPRYQEAARYYLHYAGMPDSLVYLPSDGSSDVTDDIQSRGEWVNYLVGAPFGPEKDREAGLGIPIDLSLAFHTDAGITTDDSVIGTLLIYSIKDLDSLRTFPDQVSRLANRDLADIMQTQIVEDLRQTWNPDWNRRFLFNRRYSEATRPNVPSVLLELLSHQNFTDIQYAHDPAFRFDVSRSIYKAILRFIAHRNQQDYVIQPLPVSNMRVLPAGDDRLWVRWDPVADPLEPDACADRFVVYKSENYAPFDRGRVTDKTELLFENLNPGVLYRFKVVAANDGGKSFPSEILSASLSEKGTNPLLIINGFEMVSGPDIVDENGFKGFPTFLDIGVPDKQDLHFTGDQHDFDPNSMWKSNDAPGHGASFADYETRILSGNTFDFTSVYGDALLEMGIPYVSASIASIIDRQVDLSDYPAAMVIFGNQKAIKRPGHETYRYRIFPKRMREEITRYLNMGGRLFISGSHIGSDVDFFSEEDPDGVTFVEQCLGYRHITNFASRTGVVQNIHSDRASSFYFNMSSRSDTYNVIAPDAIQPTKISENRRSAQNMSDELIRGCYTDTFIYETDSSFLNSGYSPLEPAGPEVLFRYDENQFSAGVGYRNTHYAVISLGFPFETIIDPEERVLLLRDVLDYLKITDF